MTPRDPDPRSFLPLTPLVFQVMLALAGEARHGYGIILDVTGRTDGLIRLRTGTLYVLLQRLVEQRLIEDSDAPSRSGADDAAHEERRKYYALTPFGRSVMQAEARRLESVVSDARRKHVLGRSSRA